MNTNSLKLATCTSLIAPHVRAARYLISESAPKTPAEHLFRTSQPIKMKFTITSIACITAGTSAEDNVVATTPAADINAAAVLEMEAAMEAAMEAKLVKEVKELTKTNVELKEELANLLKTMDPSFNQTSIDKALEATFVKELEKLKNMNKGDMKKNLGSLMEAMDTAYEKIVDPSVDEDLEAQVMIELKAITNETAPSVTPTASVAPAAP